MGLGVTIRDGDEVTTVEQTAQHVTAGEQTAQHVTAREQTAQHVTVTTASGARSLLKRFSQNTNTVFI